MRGYWLPQGFEKLFVYDGFFIKSTGIYIGHNAEKDWNIFLDSLNAEIKKHLPEFSIVNAWKTYKGIMRYVVAQSDNFQIIADDLDGYVTVYLIVPEKLGKCKRTDLFKDTLNTLRKILIRYYPNDLYHRKNYRELKKVARDDGNG